MLASWANTIVLVGIGLSIGAAGAMTRILAPSSLEELYRPKPGESIFRGTMRRTEKQQEIIREAPTSFRLAAYAQVALVLVLVVVLWLSPVDLGWWTLLLSIAAGALVTGGTFKLARSGRLQAAGPSFLDPIAGVDLAAEPRRSSAAERPPG